MIEIFSDFIDWGVFVLKMGGARLRISPGPPNPQKPFLPSNILTWLTMQQHQTLSSNIANPVFELSNIRADLQGSVITGLT
jgi:hypothetical protein